MDEFNEARFRAAVDEALVVTRRVLDNTRTLS